MLYAMTLVHEFIMSRIALTRVAGNNHVDGVENTIYTRLACASSRCLRTIFSRWVLCEWYTTSLYVLAMFMILVYK